LSTAAEWLARTWVVGSGLQLGRVAKKMGCIINAKTQFNLEMQ